MLVLLLHAYNCTKHESTNYSPYYLMYGRKPRLAIDVVLGLASAESAEQNYCKYVEALKSKLSAAYELADSNANKSRLRQKSIVMSNLVVLSLTLVTEY